MSEDRILLTDMVFHGRHGTLQAEHELGQLSVVSVEVQLDLRPAGTSDDLAKTVDYGEVRRSARGIVEAPPVRLTETVAERIASGTVDQHPEVEAVKARLGNPHLTAGRHRTRRLCRRDLASPGSQIVGCHNSGSRTAPAAHAY
jgi:dihydroneopterin aldolase